MRSRCLVLALALVALAAAGCSSDGSPDSRSMPEFRDDHRVEQINSPGR